MVAYTREETVGATELSKSFGSYLDKVVKRDIEKLAIVRHNKTEAVMVSADEYENMKDALEILETIEVLNILDTRVSNGKIDNGISVEELKNRLRKRGRNV